jgi:hypothetical protein
LPQNRRQVCGDTAVFYELRRHGTHEGALFYTVVGATQPSRRILAGVVYSDAGASGSRDGSAINLTLNGLDVKGFSLSHRFNIVNR